VQSFDPGAVFGAILTFLEGSLLFFFIVDIFIFPYLKYYCGKVYMASLKYQTQLVNQGSAGYLRTLVCYLHQPPCYLHYCG
jgi:hypothetical protein